MPSRLPRVGLHEVPERWPKSRFLIFILSHKSQLDVFQEGEEGVEVSRKRQNDVIKDKIYESSLKESYFIYLS